MPTQLCERTRMTITRSPPSVSRRRLRNERARGRTRRRRSPRSPPRFASSPGTYSRRTCWCTSPSRSRRPSCVERSTARLHSTVQAPSCRMQCERHFSSHRRGGFVPYRCAGRNRGGRARVVGTARGYIPAPRAHGGAQLRPRRALARRGEGVQSGDSRRRNYAKQLFIPLRRRPRRGHARRRRRHGRRQGRRRDTRAASWR